MIILIENVFFYHIRHKVLPYIYSNFNNFGKDELLFEIVYVDSLGLNRSVSTCRTELVNQSKSKHASAQTK